MRTLLLALTFALAGACDSPSCKPGQDNPSCVDRCAWGALPYVDYCEDGTPYCACIHVDMAVPRDLSTTPDLAGRD